MVMPKTKKLQTMGARRIDPGQMLLGLSTLILFLAVAMPMFMIVYNTFLYGFSFDWNLFITTIFRADTLKAMWNTIKIAVLVTLFGTIVGLFF